MFELQSRAPLPNLCGCGHSGVDHMHACRGSFRLPSVARHPRTPNPGGGCPLGRGARQFRCLRRPAAGDLFYPPYCTGVTGGEWLSSWGVPRAKVAPLRRAVTSMATAGHPLPCLPGLLGAGIGRRPSSACRPDGEGAFLRARPFFLPLATLSPPGTAKVQSVAAMRKGTTGEIGMGRPQLPLQGGGRCNADCNA